MFAPLCDASRLTTRVSRSCSAFRHRTARQRPVQAPAKTPPGNIVQSVVERTIAWLNRCRRLAKDWESCHPSDFLARGPFLGLKGIRRAWGGLRMGGIATVAAAIGADLAARLPRQNKKQREGLALLVATALDVRDVNLMELAAALPRAAERLDMRYQWISRLLGNALIDTDE